MRSRFGEPAEKMSDLGRKFLTLEAIEAEIVSRSRQIGACENHLPTFGYSEQSGRPHIEVDERGYHYAIAERGTEFERLTTHDIDKLQYSVFESITFRLACDYEVKHRVEKRDCRRILFRRQTELLSALSHEWAKRCEQDHTQVLQEHPFDDDASVRATLTKELRDQGYTPDDAQRIAWEKYPGPNH